MNHTKSHTIRLLNTAYEIKCPENEIENLDLAAKKLNDLMLENKKRFRQLSDFQALLLSSLHITHEAITNQTKQVERQSQLEEFIGSLEQKINNAGADSISEPAEEK